MCCKAVETTRNINNEFDPGTGDSRSFAKETRPLTMRSAVFGRGMFTTANWEDHRSWSSYNYAGSCWRTQHGPLYGHLTFEANWKSESLVSGYLTYLVADCKSKKKSSFWSVVLILHNYSKPFLDQIMTCDKKCIYTRQQPAQRLDREEAARHFPKLNLNQKMSWSLVVCCPSDSL